jgi:hypothetical protein
MFRTLSRWLSHSDDVNSRTNPQLKRTVKAIEDDVAQLLHTRSIKPQVWSFGAYYIDPKLLVFVVGVTTDTEKNALKLDDQFLTTLTNLLAKHDWPEQARSAVVFDIESQETVDRETKGHWWYHYK